MRLNVAGGVIAVLVIAALIVAYSALFTLYPTHQALVLRLGKPQAVITDAGLHVKAPFIDSVVYIDKRILDLEAPAQEVIASDQKRLVVDAFARYRIHDALRFYQTLGSQDRRRFAARDPAQFGAAARAGRGDLHPRRARPARRADGAHPRSDRSRGGELRHPGGRRAHPARRPAGAEQPGGLQAHADRAPARGGRVPRRRQSARAGNPLARRPRGDRAGGGRQVEGRADPRRGRRHPQRDLRQGLRPGSGLLRVLSLDAGLRRGPQAGRHAAAAQAGQQLLPLLQQPERQAVETEPAPTPPAGAAAPRAPGAPSASR